MNENIAPESLPPEVILNDRTCIRLARKLGLLRIMEDEARKHIRDKGEPALLSCMDHSERKPLMFILNRGFPRREQNGWVVIRWQNERQWFDTQHLYLARLFSTCDSTAVRLIDTDPIHTT